MYFTGAGESIRLRVQDGRVAARCGAAWRGTVWCGVVRRGVVRVGAMRRTRAALYMLRGSERCAMLIFKRRSSIGSGFE